MTKIHISMSGPSHRTTLKSRMKDIERDLEQNTQLLEQKQKTLEKYKTLVSKLEHDCSDLQTAISRDTELLERFNQEN